MTPLMHARLQGVNEAVQRRALIVAVLRELVPLHVEAARLWTPEQRCARAVDAAEVIAYGSKCDETRGRHGGGPALFAEGIPDAGGDGSTLNSLARGIALLALQPGGVILFGEHWEATP